MGLRSSYFAYPALKRWASFCRPYGARISGPSYPGLTPWANFRSALRAGTSAFQLPRERKLLPADQPRIPKISIVLANC